MPTINFLYRSVKDKAPLNIRLLFRITKEAYPNGFKDFVIGAKTQLIVTKHYWNKQHNLKRVKEIAIANEQIAINNELNKIENHVLSAFNQSPIESIDKGTVKAHRLQS